MKGKIRNPSLACLLELGENADEKNAEKKNLVTPFV
jgi:hypothetical protein